MIYSRYFTTEMLLTVLFLFFISRSLASDDFKSQNLVQLLNGARSSANLFQDKASCTLSNFNKCYLTYFGKFDFNSVPSYGVYARTLAANENSAADLDKLCGYFKTLRNCIGDDSCVTSIRIKNALHTNSSDAKMFYADYQQWRYACWDGYNGEFSNVTVVVITSSNFRG